MKLSSITDASLGPKFTMNYVYYQTMYKDAYYFEISLSVSHLHEHKCNMTVRVL